MNAVRKTIEDGLGARTTILVSTLGDTRADIQAQINGGLGAFVVLLMMAGRRVDARALSGDRAAPRDRGAQAQVRGMALVESSTLVAVAFVLSVPLGTFLSGAFREALRASHR